MSVEVKKQEKLNIIEEQNFRKRELLEKYIAKILYKQNDKKLERK